MVGNMVKELKTLAGWQKYFICFMTYAFGGWLYEVFLEVVIYRWGYSDRGILFGPYCPIYGVGAMVLMLSVDRVISARNNSPTKNDYILEALKVLVICIITATLLELLASYLCEILLGSWPWQTYVRDYPNTNFQGRIALSPSIRFGLLGLLVMYGIQPVLNNWVSKLDTERLTFISLKLLLILSIDIVITIALKIR